ALRATPPASWGRNPKRPVGLLPRGAAAERATQWFLPRWSGSETGTDDDFPKDFSPVERQRNGGVRPKAGRGRERSEPGDTLEFPSGPAAPYIAEEAKPRTSPPAGGRGKVPPAERSEAEG